MWSLKSPKNNLHRVPQRSHKNLKCYFIINIGPLKAQKNNLHRVLVVSWHLCDKTVSIRNMLYMWSVITDENCHISHGWDKVVITWTFVGVKKVGQQREHMLFGLTKLCGKWSVVKHVIEDSGNCWAPVVLSMVQADMSKALEHPVFIFFF